MQYSGATGFTGVTGYTGPTVPEILVMVLRVQLQHRVDILHFILEERVL